MDTPSDGCVDRGGIAAEGAPNELGTNVPAKDPDTLTNPFTASLSIATAVVDDITVCTDADVDGSMVTDCRLGWLIPPLCDSSSPKATGARVEITLKRVDGGGARLTELLPIISLLDSAAEADVPVDWSIVPLVGGLF